MISLRLTFAQIRARIQMFMFDIGKLEKRAIFNASTSINDTYDR